jgi:hypothetical protein
VDRVRSLLEGSERLERTAAAKFPPRVSGTLVHDFCCSAWYTHVPQRVIRGTNPTITSCGIVRYTYARGASALRACTICSATSMAASRLDSAAIPLPAISKAVP